MLCNIQHYFIGHLTIWTSYSAGDYQKDAFKKLNELFIRIPIILIVGGSGLYGKVIFSGINNPSFISTNISNNLHTKITLQKELKKKYHIYFDRNNYHRFLCSLKFITINHSFHIFKIGLILPRKILFDKINQRVEFMIKYGFLEEAQECYAYKNLNALQTIGYIDIFNYFNGKISFDKIIEEIKKNTRHYAKRQITWYKKERKFKWFSSFKENEIIKYVKKKINYIKTKCLKFSWYYH
jgi:tRNA dimethylallyltransferase